MLAAVDVTKRMPLHGRRHGQWFTAVDSASLTLETGKVVALVGESGSGKSTLARILTLGDEPSAGTIRLAGKEVSTRRRADRQAHAGQVQLIMQDPFASLNQLHRVRYILSRPLRNFGKDGDLTERIIELLERVNLTPGEQYIDKYPHELSGGQRQRVAIARALAADPVVLIGDEPVSMLDVSIRLDVLRLFADLCVRDGLAMLYITHDIASARYFADEINVIYAARMVEGGPAEEVTQRPRHPYTQLLLESSPDPDRVGARRTLPIVDASNEPLDREQELAGCPFAARCPEAMPVCTEQPPPTATTPNGHWSRCWLND